MKLPFGGREKERVSFLGASTDAIRALRDVGRASAEKGVESLGKLTRQPVKIEASAISLVPVDALELLVGADLGSAQVLAAMTFERDARGFGALALGRDASMRLVDLLLGKAVGSTTQMGKLEESAVAETANIALNSMVTAAAASAGASFKTGVPEASFDAAARVRDLAKAPAGEDHAVIVRTRFSEPTTGVGGTLALVFFVRAEG